MQEIEDKPAGLEIDVMSDVVCPWCFIGKRKLDAACAQFPDVAFDIRWRPFQLDPTIPPEGMKRLDYLTRKFGADRLASFHDRISEAGAEAGIAFAFDAITRSPNTLDAHRLIRWSHARNRQHELVDRLFRLYFIEGQDLGDRDLLVSVADEFGLDGSLVRRLLDDGTDVGSVREEIATAARMGVSGVPFFIFGGKLAVSGAQPEDVLQEAIRRSLADASS
ncbi:MAG: DsbA family oxidoreductase [Beijerinckiaceae bacterium]|nr:DsbA family oxidoreductase [Beijerinckiaceae bacterium]